MGKKVYQLKTSDKMVRLASFYKRYGVLTLFVGRCIPFGFRNGIFMTAGAAKMKFYKFLLTDGAACFAFSALLFYLAYSCGQNYDALAASVHKTSVLVGITVAVISLAVITYYYLARRKKATIVT